MSNVVSQSSESSTELVQRTFRERTRRKPQLLLIEDDESHISFVQDACDTFGCKLTRAKDVTEAIERLESGFRPKMILIDLTLTQTERGEEIIKFVEEKKLCVPIVSLSGDSIYWKSIDNLPFLVLIPKPLDTEKMEMLLKFFRSDV